MIVHQASNALQALDRLEGLDKAKNEQEHLDATLRELRETSKIVDSVLSAHEVIRDTYSPANASEIHDQFKQIIASLDDSLQHFQTERRQVDSVRRVKQRATALSKLLGEAWRSYVQLQCSHYFSLLSLIESLPEVRGQAQQLSRIVARIEELQREAPPDSQVRAEYQSSLEQLKDRLASVDGLTPNIQIFLAKVANQQATINDIDDEILTWCSHEQRADAFGVFFKTG